MGNREPEKNKRTPRASRLASNDKVIQKASIQKGHYRNVLTHFMVNIHIAYRDGKIKDENRLRISAKTKIEEAKHAYEISDKKRFNQLVKELSEQYNRLAGVSIVSSETNLYFQEEFGKLLFK